MTATWPRQARERRRAIPRVDRGDAARQASGDEERGADDALEHRERACAIV